MYVSMNIKFYMLFQDSTQLHLPNLSITNLNLNVYKDVRLWNWSSRCNLLKLPVLEYFNLVYFNSFFLSFLKCFIIQIFGKFKSQKIDLIWSISVWHIFLSTEKPYPYMWERNGEKERRVGDEGIHYFMYSKILNLYSFHSGEILN